MPVPRNTPESRTPLTPAELLDQWQQWDLLSRRPSERKLQRVSGGLTNRCWRLTTREGDFIIRENALNSEQLDIDRESEYRIQQRAAHNGLAPSVHYREASDRYWIMDFLHGHHLRPPQSGSDLYGVLNRLVELHSLPFGPDLPQLSITAKAQHYWQALQLPDEPIWQEARESLQETLDSVPDDRQCICHMDPHPDNWRYTVQGWKLIDWEYTAVGHPWWDIAGLMQAVNMDHGTLRQCQEFLNINPQAHSWKLAWNQIRYLCVLWYGVQGLLQSGKPAPDPATSLREMKRELMSLMIESQTLKV